MHRIASLPGNDPQEEITFIEQPNAPVIFLTSATSDITCLSSVLKQPKNKKWRNKIRALPIAYLSSNASIDHYISNTCNTAEIVVVRFLGSRSYWSYGFEQLSLWQLEKPNRQLIVVSGIESTANDLKDISSIKKVQVDLKNKSGKVVFNANVVDLSAIENRITSIGYNVNNKLADIRAYEKLELCCKKPKEN